MEEQQSLEYREHVSRKYLGVVRGPLYQCQKVPDRRRRLATSRRKIQRSLRRCGSGQAAKHDAIQPHALQRFRDEGNSEAGGNQVQG
jgi:hypothetical protein